MMQNFRDDGEAQIITLAGVTIALTVVLLAIVINTAAISGQRTAMQEVDDAHYVFKNVRDVYGDVLRQASNNGVTDPFKNDNLRSAELNMTKMCNAHGYSVLFKDKVYDSSINPPTATALLIFSDGDTIYRDRVTYTLAWIVQRLQFVEGSLNVSSSKSAPSKQNDTISFNVTNVASHDVTIDKMRVSWDPIESGEKLEEIWIDGEEVWNKNVDSGTEVDIINATIASGETISITLIFNKNMADKIFTVEFIYIDGLSDSITFET